MCGCRQRATENTAEYVMLSNPLPVKFGDPFILPASDGKFYLYGTSLSDGFETYVSDNLVEWEKCGQVYKGGADGQWNKDCFWAPEVYERDGKYYMFYSANSHSTELNNKTFKYLAESYSTEAYECHKVEFYIKYPQEWATLGHTAFINFLNVLEKEFSLEECWFSGFKKFNLFTKQLYI